ncbi:TPA: acyltransferase [Klebsiella pneumoniae]|nr:acyltransferase [Klebsiella pneumoniae]
MMHYLDVPIILMLITLGVLGACASSGITNRYIIKFEPPEGSRFGCIDGLRGYLALFVAIYHYYIFYDWFNGKEWGHPKISLINNIGVGSVHIFFMITAYLFIKKINKPSVNWKELYVSRLFRICPLYYLAVVITFVYAYMIGGDTLIGRENIKDIIKWLMFNGYYIGEFKAGIITAGVTWTLRYEWLFYLLLPILFFIIRSRTFKVLVLCLFLYLLSTEFEKIGFTAVNFTGFFIGAAVALFEVKIKETIGVVSKRIQNIIFVLAILASVCINVENYLDLVYLQCACGVIFVLVIAGNDFFGLLSKKTSIILGEISYSIYLMHGIVIYTVFYVLDLFRYITSFTEYALIIPFVMFIVVVVSSITFTFIEKPMIYFGKEINNRYVKRLM